jgi:bleomycin hydrolase
MRPWLALPLCAALAAAQPPSQDHAIYKDKVLLPREKQELADRDQFLANRRGKPYTQAEEPVGKALSLDFSKLERPHDLTEFKTAWHTPPKRQWWTNTCWCFSTTSFLESEAKRLNGQELKLSEMYTVYWDYVEKAREFVRTKGQSIVEEGSESEAVLLRWKQYGIVPEAAFTGLVGGQTVFNHELLIEELNTYLAGVKKIGGWDEPTVLACVRAILDRHLGVPPAKVTVGGRELTPLQYLQEVVKVNPEDYVEFMSQLHVPFWTRGEYPVPDNWWHSKNYMNVPLADWYGGLAKAVQAGYTVAIGGDVSEPGYEGAEDCAIVPTFDCPQDAINQDSREFRISNKTTDDDHGIHIVGFTRKAGHDWFLIKDSARGSQRGVPGYTFYRDDYVKLKMLTFLVHKDAVKNLTERFK